MVVGVYYAPPGATGSGGDTSAVTYADGFMSGTSQNVSQAFSQSTTVSGSLSYGTSAGKSSGETGLGGHISAGISGTWPEMQDNSSSISIALNETQGSSITGPTALGVSHEYDRIAVWLDPMVNTLITGPNSIVDLGDVLDPRDPLTADGSPDVVYLSVRQLEGLLPIPAGTQALLQRTWDPNQGALDSADYANILAADPFVSDPGLDPNNSSRFPNMDQIIYYEGDGTSSCQTYSASYSNTGSETSGATDTHSVTYSLGGSSSFYGLTAAMHLSQTFTYINSWSSTISQGSSQSASFDVCAPPLNYAGLPYVAICKDNVYGTFMFYPVS